MLKSDNMNMRTRFDGGDPSEFRCVTTALPQNPALTMAYVPFQLYGKTYDPEQALRNGTLFPDLDKPFCDWKGAAR